MSGPLLRSSSSVGLQDVYIRYSPYGTWKLEVTAATADTLVLLRIPLLLMWEVCQSERREGVRRFVRCVTVCRIVCM